MWPFKPKGNDDLHKVVWDIHTNVQESFGKVREDTVRLYEWIKFLQQKSKEQEHKIKEQKKEIQNIHGHYHNRLNEQEKELSSLKNHVNNIPLTTDEIRELLDQYYSNEKIESRIKELNERVDHVLALQAPVMQRINQIPQPSSSNPEEDSKHHLKEKLLKDLSRSSKDYVKSMISSLVQKHSEISALKLKEILVENQKICSRTSFYRIIREMEVEGILSYVTEGRLKTYFTPEGFHQ